MLIIFIGFILILSTAIFVVSQYYPDNFIVFLIYIITICMVCIVFFILERKKRHKIITYILDIFDGKFNGISIENELSILERQVMLRVKNNETIEAKIIDSYKNIASLISDISHQCKTPLSSIIMHNEMLPANDVSDVIHSQTEKLSFLLDALTKISKCEGGLITENINPQKYVIANLVCRAVNDVFVLADNKKIEILSDIPIGLTANFDMRWTSEALFNILDNAVKYSDEGSTIKITAYSYEMFVCIDIIDNGEGIPESEINNIWQRFYRGKNHLDNNNGVGIGLYLSRMILNSEGGYISVKSQVGQGSKFSIFLPI